MNFSIQAVQLLLCRQAEDSASVARWRHAASRAQHVLLDTTAKVLGRLTVRLYATDVSDTGGE